MAKLSALKKKRGQNFEKLQDKLKQSEGSFPRDERIWKPKFNKDKGKGECIVRLLTPVEGDPMVEQMSYSFNGPGGNYYDLARQTIGEDDPIQIASINLFRKAKATGDKSWKEKGIKLLPRSQYFANVYVIKDEEVPENEGKVFIYQFGRAIFNVIKEAIEPEFGEKFDPFDYWEGADLIIRMTAREMPDRNDPNKKIVVPNYDKTVFDDQGEFLDGDEDAIEEVYNKTYELSEFVDPEKFKSFDEVAERFKKVTGKPYNWLAEDFNSESYAEEKEEEKEHEETVDNDDGSDKHREPDPEPEAEEEPEETEAEEESGDDDNDPLAKFRKLSQK